MADNQEVTHESGCSRFCSALCCAFMVAPALLVCSMGVLGWNERRAVCDGKAIAQGKEQVLEIGCSSPNEGSGKLVMFDCDLSTAGVTPLRPTGDFSSASFTGIGLRTTVEMLQCVEHEHKETKKDNVGGGKTTVTTYTYSIEWRSSYVDSYAFRKLNSQNFLNNCGMHNPAWPSTLPQSGTVYQQSVMAGSFTLPSEFVQKVPIDTDITTFATPSGWSQSGAEYTTRVGNGWGQIGQTRVRFQGNNNASPRVTVLGKNNQGTISRWVASDSWLCSGFTLGDLRTGTVSRDDLFAALASQASALTWILRFLGFAAMWFAFSRLFGPLEVAADCIPCIGPCLGDSIEAIACCVSCLPGCACALGVIGIVWVVMRPLVGIPLILFFLVVLCGFLGYKYYSKNKNDARDVGVSDPPAEEAPPAEENPEADQA